MPSYRLRRACERCREKKTKCPGEKPICSFCLRLNESCDYLQRSKPKIRRHDSRSSSAHRVQQLETQVRDLINLMRNSPHDVSKNELSNVVEVASYLDSTTAMTEVNGMPRQFGHMLDAQRVVWSNENPEPPLEVLEHFVNIYKTRVYFQPLPLFRITGLRERIQSAPSFLRYSFFAMMLHYTCHDFFTSSLHLAQHFYESEAQREVDAFSVRSPNLQLIQAFCLLALTNVLENNPRAWINIGTAARLEALRNLLSVDTPEDIDDDSANCYWSVCALEKAFSPQISTFAQLAQAPKYPRSAQVPMALATGALRSYPRDLAPVDDQGELDAGINAYSLRAISVWGNIVSNLHSIRAGIPVKPWKPTSTFAQLNVELYELEADVSYKHLFRAVEILGRNAHDLEEVHEYWAPWFLFQILAHAGFALLNHPFIHLVALRESIGATMPRVFLQQTVDQALFHSSWVIRLLETAKDIGLEVYDPLIGGAVMATTTISWIFQFARDRQVSQKAKANVLAAQSFLKGMAIRWPYLETKLEILQQLQEIACQKWQESSDDTTQITFQPRKIWTLLDTSIIDMTSQMFTDTGTPQTKEPSNTSATLRVATTFIHPVIEDETNTQAKDNNAVSFENAESYMDISLDIDKLLSGFLSTGLASTSWTEF